MVGSKRNTAAIPIGLSGEQRRAASPSCLLAHLFQESKNTSMEERDVGADVPHEKEVKDNPEPQQVEGSVEDRIREQADLLEPQFLRFG